MAVASAVAVKAAMIAVAMPETAVTATDMDTGMTAPARMPTACAVAAMRPGKSRCTAGEQRRSRDRDERFHLFGPQCLVGQCLGSKPTPLPAKHSMSAKQK